MKRFYIKEMMDDFSIEDERIDVALRELNIINKFLGGNAASLEGIKKVRDNLSINTGLKILDTGAGASDILTDYRRPDKEEKIFALDLNKRTCIYSKKHNAKIINVCGDVNNFPFKEKSFDIIHASLFLHHFKDEDLPFILGALIRSAKRAVVINDLRRSIFAYAGIFLLTRLFSKSEMVKNDGPVSVKRGFIKSELRSILSKIKIEKYVIKRRWAFRWLVIIYPDG